MAVPSQYKPSPLGYGSPRSSPFRRPESPASPAGVRQSTPPASPSRVGQVNGNPRFGRESTPTSTAVSTGTTPRGYAPPVRDDSQPQFLASPAHISSRPGVTRTTSQNALAQLQPPQVRMLRDGFQILDRDSDGMVNREDVTDMLNQLGFPSGPSEVSQFFPPGGQQTMSLAVFLNSLASVLAALAPDSELLSAFSAFDDDDSGQVDLAELRDALLRTAPEPGERALTASEVDKIMSGFSGRRAFSKNSMGGLGKRGEVFKYQEFVKSIVGGNGSSEANSNEEGEE